MLTNVLRTVVPALWGSFIGWLLTLLPVLEPHRAEFLLYGDLMVPILASVIIGGWFAFWRWLQPRLPDWLVRVTLGSAKLPVYVPPKTEAIVRADGTVDLPGPDHRA